MIIGLTQILIFQGIGEILSKFLIPSIPGPVIGLVTLLLYLFLKKEVNKDLSMVSETFTQHLGLLFIPAAVGAILYLPAFAENAFAIAASLLGSLTLTFVVSVLVLRLLTAKGSQHEA